MGIILVVLNILANIALGFTTYLKNPKSATNILFGLLSLIIIFWSITNYFSLYSADKEEILRWIRLTMLVTVPLTPVLFLLIHTFPNNRLRISNKLLFPIVLVVGFNMVMAPSDFIYSSVEIKNGEVAPIPGSGLVLYALTLFGFLISAFAVLIMRYLKSTGLLRKQLLFLLLGVILTFSLAALTNLLFVTVLKVTNFVVLGPLFSLILVGFTAYAIVRHRLMDIRLVVARTVAYSLLVLIVISLYVGVTFAIGNLFLGYIGQRTQLILYALLTIVIALSFESMRKGLEKATDHVLFRGAYNTDEVLSHLGSIMSTNIELKPLTAQIIQVLIEQMRISKGAFVILGEGSTSIYDITDIGFPKKLVVLYNQLQPFFSIPQTIVFDELEESQVKILMREMGISIVKTLKVKGVIVGLLLLGEKESGDIYSEQDLRVLEILAPEAAIAIQNAQSYDKIKKFNITLTEEVKKATFDLQQANTRLKELDQLKDDFVSIASHELRTPMTAIRSYAWMALNKSDIPLSEKMKKYLDRTLISTERLINLVNDMLNISRIESGRVEILPSAFDIQDLVTDVFDEVEPKAKERNLQLKVVRETLPRVFADSDKIHQVLLNLIGNALKFTPAAGTISVSFFTDGKVVETAIKDSGVGISQEDLPRLFRKFGRLDNSYVAMATSGGTGLGLYISKSLVEMMHGRIWVSSEGLGKGSTFTFSLPIATEEVLRESEKYTKKVEGEVKHLEPVAI